MARPIWAWKRIATSGRVHPRAGTRPQAGFGDSMRRRRSRSVNHFTVPEKNSLKESPGSSDRMTTALHPSVLVHGSLATHAPGVARRGRRASP